DDAIDAMLDDISALGVMFSPENARDIALRHGASPHMASELATTWTRALDEASAIGAEFSVKVHFPIGDERVIEQKLHLKTWAPFHFWATRNLPFYLDTLAANH